MTRMVLVRICVILAVIYCIVILRKSLISGSPFQISHSSKQLPPPTGYIDAAELKSSMESLGYKNKNKMVYNMIESMPSGMINFEQFLDLMSARVSDTDSREDIAKVFRLFSNDAQYITLDNLQKVARELGEPMSAAELREMIERADANGDNRIDFEEFFAIMTNKNLE